MITYRYNIAGTDSSGATWSVSGTTDVTGPGQFAEALDQAQMAAFLALTEGRAKYGRPGQGECRGPYRFTRLEIEELSAING